MNLSRIAEKTKQVSEHGTYIMSSSFRVLDNHALYYLLQNYKTYNVIIYRNPIKVSRHDDYFNGFVLDLISTLSTFVEVQYVKELDLVYPLIQGDIILDTAYLKEEKATERKLISYAKYNNLGYITIESNVVVPVHVASDKEEYSARTIRTKIQKLMYDFIDPVLDSIPISKMEKKALKHCQSFIKDTLPLYHLKNHPEFDYTSSLSVYLKYGIISPIRVFLLLEESKHPNKDLLLEELIIRRELSYNFVYYNEKYFDFDHMTYGWAYQTMEVHQFDLKEYIYTVEDYISFNTHDIYFNAAMKEMVLLGKMHGYMRMYWCKKIIEWSPNFKYAYDTAIYLNNHFFYDGNTPNGYTGVAWCFGKHDRAWHEREIFGKLRYMNSNGLRRKFDIDSYILRIEEEVK